MAFLDGTYDAGAYNSSGSSAAGSPHYSRADVEQLKAALQQMDGELDLLLTCEWPQGLLGGVPKNLVPSGAQEAGLGGLLGLPGLVLLLGVGVVVLVLLVGLGGLLGLVVLVGVVMLLHAIRIHAQAAQHAVEAQHASSMHCTVAHILGESPPLPLPSDAPPTCPPCRAMQCGGLRHCSRAGAAGQATLPHRSRPSHLLLQAAIRQQGPGCRWVGCPASRSHSSCT